MRPTLLICCFIPWLLYGQPFREGLELSVAMEARASLDRSTGFLLAVQADDGSWSRHPGITAVCLMALLHGPAHARPDVQAAVAKAAEYLARQVRRDGSVSRVPGDLDVYSTSVVLMALSSLDGEAHADKVELLMKRLIESQLPTGPGYGGLGFRYATSTYPDLSNTHWALEALHVATGLRGEAAPERLRKLWQVARMLILDCQVPAELEGMPAEAQGGFTYYPLKQEMDDKRHAELLEHSPVWGSLTYGAVKSLIYAGMAADEAPILAAREWLARHYTVRENPGLGNGGLYYYYYMLASTRMLLGETTVTTADGRQRDWRYELVNQLLTRQQGNGAYSNSRRLWMEDDQNLCTAYAMLALEMVLGD